MRMLLSRELETPVVVPPDPQIVGALGAALFAQQSKKRTYPLININN
jgi:activator of 2-hydroxyglutaryl-CoA dehydratase